MTVRFHDLGGRWQERTRWRQTRDGRCRVLEIDTPAGWRTLDSWRAPLVEARRCLEQLSSSASTDVPVIVLGAGSGFVTDALLDAGHRHIVAITGSQIAGREQMRRANQTAASTSAEIAIIAAKDSDSVWQQVLRPLVRDKPGTTSPCSIIVNPREREIFGALIGKLELLVESYAYPLTLERQRPPQRILIPGAHDMLEIELIDELRRRGITVIEHPAIDGVRISPSQAWALLREHRPDLVLCTNNRGSDTQALLPMACEVAGIPWAAWHLDDPTVLLHPSECQGQARERIAFAWDANGFDSWRELGFRHVHALPLATDPRKFSPGPGDPSLTGRLVFVGTPRFAQSEGFFAALDHDPAARRVVETLGPEVAATRRAPSRARIDDVLIELGLDEHFTGESRRRLPAFVVQHVSFRYRVDTLTAIADLEPVVYGYGWEGLLPARVELRGPARYDHEVPTIFRSDAVHLSLTNFQMRSHPNQRLFDVGASGSVVLQDQLEGLSSMLGGGFEALLFSGVEELRAKATALLDDPARRAELAALLRAKILAEHTMAHRVDRILELLGTRRLAA